MRGIDEACEAVLSAHEVMAPVRFQRVYICVQRLVEAKWFEEVSQEEVIVELLNLLGTNRILAHQAYSLAAAMGVTEDFDDHQRIARLLWIYVVDRWNLTEASGTTGRFWRRHGEPPTILPTGPDDPRLSGDGFDFDLRWALQ